MPRLLTRLVVLSFLSQTGFAAALPAMPLFLRVHGLPVAWMGVYTAAYAVPSVLLRPAAGRLSDRSGRRPLIAAGFLLQAVALAAFLLPLPVAGYLAARALTGAGSALAGPALAALAADLAHEGQRGRVFGAMNSAGTAGYILGPVGGGLVAGLAGDTGVFLVSMAAFVGGLLAALALPSPERAEPPANAARPRARLLPLLRHLWPLLTLNAAWMGANGVNDAVWVLYLHRLGASPMVIGLAFGLFGLPLLLLPYVFGRFADRLGRHDGLLILGALADAAFFVLYAFLTRPWPAIAVSLLEAGAVSLLLPVYGAALSRRAPPFGQGEAQGLASAVGNASLFATALVGGYLFAWRRAAPFLLVASMLAAAALALAHGAPDRAAVRASSG